MQPPWSAEQVLALAPDASSQKAARGLASPSRWSLRAGAADPPSLWGLCQGSGANPYQTCVDLSEPAYRCSCPSRKFPCKHALALMLLWSAGAVPDEPPPDWVSEWLSGRGERTEKTAARPAARRPDPKSVQRRAGRVEAGVEELDRWLADQVRQGLATATRAGYEHWDTMAARLVDAQAPGLASAVRRLAGAAGTPDRLLVELSLIRLLVTAYRRVDELPPDLAATVRSRVGFPVATDDVLAGPRVRDEWAVTGVWEEADDRLTVRRVWLHGTDGRPALVLTFGAPGQSLTGDQRATGERSSLLPGSTLDADLCFYPGAQPLRALVAQRYGPPGLLHLPAGARSVSAALAGYAGALAAEPWLERWPMLLAGVTPVVDGAGRWHLRDGAGDALPLDPLPGPPWRLVAAAGGGPVTVCAEYGVGGLRPLTVWADGRMALP